MTHEKQVNFKPPHTVFTTLTHTHTKRALLMKKIQEKELQSWLPGSPLCSDPALKGPIARPVRWQWNAIIFVNRLPWVAYIFFQWSRLWSQASGGPCLFNFSSSWSNKRRHWSWFVSKAILPRMLRRKTYTKTPPWVEHGGTTIWVLGFCGSAVVILLFAHVDRFPMISYDFLSWSWKIGH